VVGRGDHQALAIILLKKLEERVEHPADFPHILSLAAPGADRVELVEQIDAPRRRHGVEHMSKLAGGLAHEPGDKAVQNDGEQGQLQFPSQGRGRHGLAGARWSHQQKLSARSQAMLGQSLPLALLQQDALEPAVQGVRQDHVRQPLGRISRAEQRGELALGLDQRHRAGLSRDGGAPGLGVIHQGFQFLRQLSVALPRLMRGELHRRRQEPGLVSFNVALQQADDEERGALGMHYTSVPNILKVLNPRGAFSGDDRRPV
jgi:hypothetical protein